MNKQNRSIIAALALTISGFSSAWAASEPVGVVITVKGIVAVTPSTGDPYFLEKNSSIYEGDIVSSTKKSFAVLSFIDRSKIVVKADTVFSVVGYGFSDTENESTLNLIKGGIRTVTGLIAKKNPDNYKLDTPVASLGVRGTSYDAVLCDQKCLDQQYPNQKRKSTPTNSECEIKLDFSELPVGGYFTVREGKVQLSKGDKVINIGPGDVAFANATSFGCLPDVPLFLSEDNTPLPESDDFREFSALQCTP